MNNEKLRITVIVSTYNAPGFLRLVLLALAEQDEDNFEVVVADDRSSGDTKKIIEELRPKVSYNLRQVWQPHDGFRAAKIRNQGVAIADGDYIIFLDGDSVPSRSFINRHRKLAEIGYIVAGNRVLLSSDFTKKVLAEDIFLHHYRGWHWLCAFFSKEINSIVPVVFLGAPSRWRYWCCHRWQGAKTCNLGIWKKDFFAINGFDESYYGWGYEDSDLVVRLMRYGVLRKDGRYAIPVFHLWHPDNSCDREQINYQQLQAVINSSDIRAEIGVSQYGNRS